MLQEGMPLLNDIVVKEKKKKKKIYPMPRRVPSDAQSEIFLSHVTSPLHLYLLG